MAQTHPVRTKRTPAASSARQRKSPDAPQREDSAASAPALRADQPRPVVPDTRTVPLHQEIATRAYFLWEHYGRPRGRDVAIWLEAERQLLGADREVNGQPGGAVPADDLATATFPRGASTPDGR